MTTLTKEANRKIWQDKANRSRLAKNLTLLHRIAKDTARGTYTEPQIICGPPGVGKTHGYVKACEEFGMPYRIIKSGTKLGLVVELDKCARKGQLALIDDADAIWRDPDQLQVLMAATSPAKEGSRSYRHVLKDGAEHYSFNGLVVVIISNTNVLNLAQFNRATRPKIEALIGRSFVVNIEATRDEIFDYTCWLAICHDMLRLAKYTRAETDDALEFFADHRHEMSNVSPRTLLKIAERRKGLPDVWQDAMAMTFDHTGERPYTGEMPRIVVGDPPVKKAKAPKTEATMHDHHVGGANQ